MTLGRIEIEERKETNTDEDETEEDDQEIEKTRINRTSRFRDEEFTLRKRQEPTRKHEHRRKQGNPTTTMAGDSEDQEKRNARSAYSPTRVWQLGLANFFEMSKC